MSRKAPQISRKVGFRGMLRPGFMRWRGPCMARWGDERKKNLTLAEQKELAVQMLLPRIQSRFGLDLESLPWLFKSSTFEAWKVRLKGKVRLQYLRRELSLYLER